MILKILFKEWQYVIFQDGIEKYSINLQPPLRFQEIIKKDINNSQLEVLKKRFIGPFFLDLQLYILMQT